jgi:hypothetical protein
VLSVALVVAGLVGAITLLLHAESKPAICPSCGAKTLIADRHGHYWRCMPCQAQFFWFGTTLQRYHGKQLGSGETVPAAKLRRGGRDRVG